MTSHRSLRRPALHPISILNPITDPHFSPPCLFSDTILSSHSSLSTSTVYLSPLVPLYLCFFTTDKHFPITFLFQVSYYHPVPLNLCRLFHFLTSLCLQPNLHRDPHSPPPYLSRILSFSFISFRRKNNCPYWATFLVAFLFVIPSPCRLIDLLPKILTIQSNFSHFIQILPVISPFNTSLSTSPNINPHYLTLSFALSLPSPPQFYYLTSPFHFVVAHVRLLVVWYWVHSLS